MFESNVQEVLRISLDTKKNKKDSNHAKMRKIHHIDHILNHQYVHQYMHPLSMLSNDWLKLLSYSS